MKKMILILALSASIPCFGADAGFTCKRYVNQLQCSAVGLSFIKRAPEWIVSQKGKQTDKAEGWEVVLYPTQGASTITMTAWQGDTKFEVTRDINQ
jgi:hypothetical protein